MELKLGTNHVSCRTNKLNLLFKVNMEKGKGPSPLCPITISATSSPLVVKLVKEPTR